jgi:hypothetical protein
VSFNVGLQLYDGTGAFATNYTPPNNSSSALPTAWTRFNGVMPPNAVPTGRSAVPLLQFTGLVDVQDIRVEEAVPGTLVVDGSITASKIAANTITGDKIAAGTITTTSLLVTPGAMAITFDPAFLDQTAWGTDFGSFITLSDGQTGVQALRSGNGQRTNFYQLRAVPCDPNRTYRCSGWARASPGNPCTAGRLYAGADFMDTSTHVLGTIWVGTTNSGILLTTTWTRFEGIFTPLSQAGANCRFLRLNSVPNGEGAAGQMDLQDFKIEEAVPGTLVVDGAITAVKIAAHTITAGQIAAGTITATEIAAGTITAGQIAAGTITTTQIAAGTITASNIAAGTITGTQIAATTITGSNIAANTITASKLSVTQLSTISADMGSINAGSISSVSISAATINGGSITGTTISGGTITGNVSNSATITGGTITGATINAGNGNVKIDFTGVNLVNGGGGPHGINWDDGSTVYSQGSVLHLNAGGEVQMSGNPLSFYTGTTLRIQCGNDSKIWDSGGNLGYFQQQGATAQLFLHGNYLSFMGQIATNTMVGQTNPGWVTIYNTTTQEFQAQSSSLRFKDHVTDWTGDGRGLLTLTPILYHFKDDPSEQLGLAAEHLYDIDQHLVSLDHEGRPFAPDTFALFACLIALAKSQDARIATLESRL